MEPTLIYKAQQAKAASYLLANSSSQQRNQVLLLIADLLQSRQATILAANKQDIALAEKGPLLDRLLLNEKRLAEMIKALKQLAQLPDVINEVIEQWQSDNGLTFVKQRIPLGLIGLIYESRPNVTIDAATLCFKSGNAVILKGGKEAINTNCALVSLMKEALRQTGLPETAVEIIEDTSRETTLELMKLNSYLDVLIPRGSAGLIASVVANATVPVIQTGAGICHTYIDEFADQEMGLAILINAKCSRPAVCNACETLLVHKNIAESFLSRALAELEKNGVAVRWSDYDVEFNDLIISIKIVDSLQEAIEHINSYGTHHSDCIVSDNQENAKLFMQAVDSACVYHNASTRFTDGFEFGYGCEIGISNQKLQPRGPLGLRELTTSKYFIYGKGQIR